MAKDSEAKPLELAAAALARRDYSAAELGAYLERRGVELDEAVRAVERLVAAGYVDDARSAGVRAEALAARGYGDAFIRADLERRGVECEQVDAVVAALEPECDRARSLVAQWGPTSGAARRLFAKGFERETIEAVIQAASWEAS